jgi:hypothetical protein
VEQARRNWIAVASAERRGPAGIRGRPQALGLQIPLGLLDVSDGDMRAIAGAMGIDPAMLDL